MLNAEIDERTGIAVFKPDGPLTEADFTAAAGVLDPYITEYGRLRGLIIRTPDFPGWESFGSLVDHIRFVRDHHQHVTHVAIVTDSDIGNLAEKLAGHFVAAEVRHFPFEDFEAAQSWILDS